MNERKMLFDEKYFEQGAGLVNSRIYNLDNTSKYLNSIANTIHQVLNPSNELDIGCAKGYLVEIFDRLGIDAYGIDISEYAVSQACTKIKNKLRIVDIESQELPFESGYFDSITVIGVLEHLYSFKSAVQEIRRVLKNDGYALVVVPTPDSRSAIADKTHVNVRPRKFWIEYFRKNGLTLVRGWTWTIFKKIFLNEIKRIMPENQPTNFISLTLTKMGSVGNVVRNSLVPYLRFFSPLRTDEILLFKK